MNNNAFHIYYRVVMVFIISLISTLGYSNDGVYYASGNHLIPIYESEISITKEVLKITRVNDRFVKVTVHYTFFNPSKHKTLLVGFEAPSPSGDVDGTPRNGQHPHISNFSVILNNKRLSYNTAIVNSDPYVKEGKIQAKTVKEVTEELPFDRNYPEFFYVYHFNALFQPGVNTIKHEYLCELSSSVVESYSFSYILTAATRWANKQIDDFTLEIDMGAYERFHIVQSFFNDESEWDTDGPMVTSKPEYYQFEEAYPITTFYTKEAPIVFKKLNFKPEEELHLSCLHASHYHDGIFNYKEHSLDQRIATTLPITKAADKLSKKILRNLPFARRGYVFKNSTLQEYYQSLPWYQPDTNYRPNLNAFSKEELKWFRRVKKQQPIN